VIDVVEVASGRWLCRFRGDHIERPVLGAVMIPAGAPRVIRIQSLR
jgi:hypothetical protein